MGSSPLSRLTQNMPTSMSGAAPSPLSRSLGGGKGAFGAAPSQANPQSAMLQQLLQAMQARRAAQMQQAQGMQQVPGAQQAPAFMSPAQRLAQMPQQAIAALTQAAPQPFFGTQPTAQAPMSPGVQAQQAYQASAPPAAPQPTAPATPAGPRAPDVIRQLNNLYSMTNGITAAGNRVVLGPNGQYYEETPSEQGGGGGLVPISLDAIANYSGRWV